MDWAGIASAILVPFLATISGGLGTYLVNRHIQNRDLISNERSRALLGRWIGTLTQDVGIAKGVCVPLIIDFEGRGKRVKGIASYNFPEGTHTRLLFDGGLLWDRFVRFDYVNPDNRKLQFGYFVGEVSPKGDEITGFYGGYGALSNGLVRGDVKLTRSA